MKIKVAETEAKYENLKKEDHIKTLAQENSYYKERNKYLIIIFSLLVLTSIFAIFFYRKRSQLLEQKHLLSEESNKLKQLSLEKSNLEIKLKNDTIELQNAHIQQKSRELVIEALNRNRINEIIQQLQGHMQPYILKFRTKKDQEAVREILFQAISLYRSKPFEEFEKLIVELHPDFLKTLSIKHKELTPREIQLCGLISLNLSTKDISLISHLSPASINSARHTIRKKMNLMPEQNLASELLKFQ